MSVFLATATAAPSEEPAAITLAIIHWLAASQHLWRVGLLMQPNTETKSAVCGASTTKSTNVPN